MKTETTLIFQILHANNRTLIDSEQVIDWLTFFELVKRHRIWHQIPLPINPHIDTSLKNLCNQDKLKILTTVAETIRITQVLHEQQISYCVLKGIALNAQIYEALDKRPCKDIDIWVDLNHLHEAIHVLKSLGYEKKLPNYELFGFKKNYYFAHKHDIAFFNKQKNTEVELHFNLNYFGIRFFTPTPDLHKTITIFKTPIVTLKDDYHLLYLMIHGAIHAWIRLRWLNDIALFIKKNHFNPNTLMQIAEQVNCEHIVIQTLILIHDLYKQEMGELAALIQNPSHRVCNLVKISKKFIASNYVMDDGIRNFKMFFYYRIYLFKLAVKKEKFAALCGDLFKVDQIFEYITLPDGLSFLYYLIYPGWVLKYVIMKCGLFEKITSSTKLKTVKNIFTNIIRHRKSH